jgi:hypothetical protein
LFEKNALVFTSGVHNKNIPAQFISDTKLQKINPHLRDEMRVYENN